MSEEPPRKRRRKGQNGEKDGEVAGQDTKRAMIREQQAADPTLMPQVRLPLKI